MKPIIIAFGFLIAVSASPLAEFPTKDVAVSPIEDFQLSEQDEREKTSEIILETIIASLGKVQGDIIEGKSQKINEGIQGILNTIQNILESRGKELYKVSKENGQIQEKIHADFVLDDSQEDKQNSKQLEMPQDSALAQEDSDQENKVINNDKESEAFDTEENKVKFIDIVPQKEITDESQLSSVAENNEQTEEKKELIQISNDFILRQPQEIQYIPPWLIRQPVPY